jgi:ABC-type branched-subunit amino acid transport system permease subunit
MRWPLHHRRADRLGVLYVLLRLVRSPFGHVLVAIRENQLRASPGLSGRTLQARCVRDLGRSDRDGGTLLAFQTYLVSAEAFSALFRRALAMVVIGGMQHAPGRAGRAVLHPVPRTVFDLDANWLLCSD